MRTRHLAATAVLAAALVLNGTSLPASASGRATAAASPIFIGQLAALTGSYASFSGTLELDAARLAVGEINAAGGINGRLLQLVVADDQSSPAGAATGFAQLTKAGSLSAVIGPVQSFEIAPLLPAIKQAGIPVLIGGTATIFTHMGNPWIFRTRPSNLYNDKALSAFAVTSLHLTKIAILHASDPSSMGSDAGMTADLTALGVAPVIDQTIPLSATDLTAQLQAIKGSGATALIGYSAYPPDYVLLGRQLHQLGMHLTLLGGTVLSISAVRKLGGAFLYDVYSPFDYAPSQNPEQVAFDRTFQTTFGMPGSYEAAYVYDAIHILAMVMQQGGTSPTAVRAGILAVRDYHGVEGTYAFDANGDGLHQQNIVQNVQGQLHLVKSFTFSSGA